MSAAEALSGLDSLLSIVQMPAGVPTGTLAATMGNVNVDDFNVSPPTMNFPTAPTMTIGTAPALPDIREVAIPDAPAIAMPDVPAFLSLQTHQFGGIDLHEDWLAKLDDIPELSVLAPAPFDYQPGARYASQLLASLKATLNARIQGGTGLVPAVEQQLWDRARDRETQVALAREQEVLRGAEALGFPLPSGVLSAQLQDMRGEHAQLQGEAVLDQSGICQSAGQGAVARAAQKKRASGVVMSVSPIRWDSPCGARRHSRPAPVPVRSAPSDRAG